MCSDAGIPLIILSGAKHAPIYSMVKDAVVCSNALAFFGSELGTYVASPGSRE